MENFIVRLTIPVLISVVLGLISFVDVRNHGEELIKKNGATPMLVITARNKTWWW